MEKVTKMFSMLMKVWRTGMKDETVFTEAKARSLEEIFEEGQVIFQAMYMAESEP